MTTTIKPAVSPIHADNRARIAARLAKERATADALGCAPLPIKPPAEMCERWGRLTGIVARSMADEVRQARERAAGYEVDYTVDEHLGV